MFENLIESKPKKERSAAAVRRSSVVIHVLLITGAVEATKGAAEVIRDRLADTTLVFLEAARAAAPAAGPAAARTSIVSRQSAAQGIPDGGAAGQTSRRTSRRST